MVFRLLQLYGEITTDFCALYPSRWSGWESARHTIVILFHKRLPIWGVAGVHLKSRRPILRISFICLSVCLDIPHAVCPCVLFDIGFEFRFGENMNIVAWCQKLSAFVSLGWQRKRAALVRCYMKVPYADTGNAMSALCRGRNKT